MRRIAACLLAALIVSATACLGEPTPQTTEGVTEPVAEPVVVKSETEGPPPPEPEEVVRESSWGLIFEIPPSLEEMIVKSSIVARVRLRSVEAAAVRRAEVYTGRPSSEYNGALALTLDVLEYLRGDTASTTITAYAYGFNTLMDEYTAPTLEDATALGQRLLALRDTRWDDREAVVFLRYNEDEKHYFLGLVRADEKWVWDFTVASTMWKAWLPDADAPAGDGPGTRSSGGKGTSPQQAQRFLLDDPANYSGGGGDSVARSMDGTIPAADSDVPTATLSNLRDTVTELVRELAGGDGSQAYRNCVVTKYEWFSNSLTTPRPIPPTEVEMASGMPAGTRVMATDSTRGLESRSDAADDGDIFFSEGPDSDVLVGAWPFVINAARPLPAGRYHAWLRWLTAEQRLCDVTPEVWRKDFAVNLTVTASATTTHESFFDPYASSTAIVGTTTVGTISWQSGRVTADLTIDVTGHALDFIGLDGTTTLSLVVADATESAGALTWSVPTQALERRRQAHAARPQARRPTPTPTPTATPTPTPTATPTPTPAPTAMCLQTGATIAAAGTPPARRSPWSCPRRLPVPIQARVARA